MTAPKKTTKTSIAKLRSAANKYPDQTTGSQTIEETRKDGNHWSAAKRAELFERGMQIIYGGTGSKNKVRSRH